MPSEPSSAVPFVDPHTGRPVDALARARLLVSSQDLAWPGVLVEIGTNGAWEVEDLAVGAHYMSVNLADRPLGFEVRGAHGFRRVVMDPGTVWFCPAGEAFTHHVREPSSYAVVTLEPEILARVTGSEPPPLRREYGVQAPALRHVISALASEAEAGGPTGLPFVETLTTALSLQVVQKFGAAKELPPPSRGGLSPAARRRVAELIEARLEEGVSVEELAREAGLSPFHFHRAFKQTFGRPPHQHLLSLRLERARRLLETPEASLAGIAHRLGFSDQSHFTRMFRKQFGVTPGAVLRGGR